MGENISTEERIAKLESENVTLFHYIKEIKDEQKEFRKLVTAVEKIANQTADNREMLEQNNTKLDDISARLTDVEHQPAESAKKRADKISDTVIAVVVTGIVNVIITALITFLTK